MDITQVISAVHQVTGITYEQMRENTRKQEIVNARQWVMYFANGTLSAIARRFGRHHATVLYARKTKHNLMEVDRQTRAEHDSINDLIGGKLLQMCINVSYK